MVVGYTTTYVISANYNLKCQLISYTFQVNWSVN